MGKDSVFDYESFYKQWFLRSRNFAQEYVSEPAEAENIVQEVFVNIYERKDLLAPDINLTVYLFSAIKNRCINYLTNKLRQRTVYASDYEQEYVDKLSLRTLEEFDAHFLGEESIERRLKEALAKLAARCRQVFVMSKIEGKKQKDIALELGISVNTVESQMAVAYRKLREELKDCLPILLFICGVLS